MHFNSKPYVFYRNHHEVKYFKKYVSLTANEGGGGGGSWPAGQAFFVFSPSVANYNTEGKEYESFCYGIY